ncbi:uncharacterized protein LOC142873399 [Microcebus murinus]|uniref:uncharacterized protein LOC142873399 n=1 Tax=Microcebus murinus TaxID=30608 RepID=UPI003F6D05FB
MVRPDALEQRSARWVVCPRAPSRRRRHLARRPAGFNFTGFLFILFASCRAVRDFPEGCWGTGGLGTSQLCLGFFLPVPELVAAPAECAPAFAGAESGLGGGCGSGAGAWPGRRPAPTRAAGEEGRGQRSPETWPELLAGRAQERCSLPPGDRPASVGVSLRFGRPLLPLSGPGDELPSGQWRERLSPRDPSTPFLFRAVADVEDAGPGLPGAASAPGALGARRELPSRAALGGVSGRGGQGKEEKGRGPTSAAEEGRRSAGAASLPSAWSRASPTPWPWLR